MTIELANVDKHIKVGLIRKLEKANALVPKTRLQLVSISKLDTSVAIIQEVRGTFKRTSQETKELCMVLDRAANSIIATKDAIGSNDMTSSLYKKFITEVSGYLSNASARISKLSPPQKANADPNSDIPRIPKHLVLSAETDKVNIRKFSAFKNKLPKTATTKKFAILSLPVLAIFKPFLTAEELTDAGFEVDLIDLYPVIREQVIIAINTKYLQKIHSDPDTYLDEIVDTIKLKTRKSYTDFGSYSFRATPEFIYYWIMPDPDVNKMRAIRGKKANVESWGFPFR